ncbi:MAG: BrnT family toxin [Chitinophagales bacterium]|nr:BrnT family toxin [Chitinophagales bacterium]
MEFIWDEGNIDKSYQKHGISPLHAMSVFKDKNAILFPDEKHSVEDPRYHIIGRDIGETILFPILPFAMKKSESSVAARRTKKRKKNILHSSSKLSVKSSPDTPADSSALITKEVLGNAYQKAIRKRLGI